MPRRRTRTDEILEELLNDPEPERPLRGYEIIRLAYAGRIPPGEYRYESEFMDGRKQIETFEADEDGRVKNLKIWIENPESAESKPKKRETSRRRSGPGLGVRSLQPVKGRSERHGIYGLVPAMLLRAHSGVARFAGCDCSSYAVAAACSGSCGSSSLFGSQPLMRGATNHQYRCVLTAACMKSTSSLSLGFTGSFRLSRFIFSRKHLR